MKNKITLLNRYKILDIFTKIWVLVYQSTDMPVPSTIIWKSNLILREIECNSSKCRRYDKHHDGLSNTRLNIAHTMGKI